MVSIETALRVLISSALERLGLLAAGAAELVLSLEAPRNPAHGDLACPVAMQLASRCRKPPLALAQSLAECLQQLLSSDPLKSCIERVEVKPPGFINFIFTGPFLQSVLAQVLEQGADFGRVGLGGGKKALVEFVSANPTGPLSVAHGRQAAVGDALASLLDFAGYQVRREYYLNDEGTQIDLLGDSLLARAREAAGEAVSFPENGYRGDYVRDLAQEFLEGRDPKRLAEPEAVGTARKFGAERLTALIREELETFGVRFDRWFPQSSLEEDGALSKTLDRLKEKGMLYESEGAWWLKSTAFGDDKDRVVIRSDGRLTYIAADIAYHRKKFERGFDLLINLWGPDHHGYIARLKAAVQALGFPFEALQIRIVQLCTLKRGSETIPMSTREGKFITLTEVMKEVGPDAARFFFLLRKMDAHLEFDLELAKKHSLENPVYYIQYAHARISNIFRNAAKEGFSADRAGTLSASSGHALLTAPEERALLSALRGFPAVIEFCARELEPFGLPIYLQGLAEAFHRFYDKHRIIGPEERLAAARLSLTRGVQVVLANGLRLLGVSAPEQM